MSVQHKDLVSCCVEALDTFDPIRMATDEHINEYTKNKNLNESDETFIKEVFSGCVRYSNIMNVVLNGYFARDGKMILRSSQNVYVVFTYLALFRLDELGMAHFRKFVRSQDVNKMHRFLNFFLDEKNLVTWMKDEWNKLYESSYVQTNLLSPILRWLPELQELIEQLASRIENKVKLKKPNIPKTEIKPFNITQPRPRSVPLPQPIPKLKPYKPAPKTTYVEPTEQTVMSQIKEKNRRKAEERLMEASRKQLACANPEKSEKTKQKLRSIIADEDSKIDFNKTKANPLPKEILQKSIPIKLNAATILREGNLFRKKEEEELKKLERLEAGARDASDFLKWQSEMKQQDLERELAEIERRRLEGKLSHEEAILARQSLIKDNRQKVEQMKEEAAEMMQKYLEKRLQEEDEMRALVEDVMAGHENAKQAKKNLQQYKSKIVQEVNEESKELMKQALELAEEEMRKKVDLIQQIRAMESVPVIRFKFVDLTQTAGHGLLGEMSTAELSERLTLLKVAEDQAEDEKRDEILASKQAKEQYLMDTLETISKHRSEQNRAAALKLEDRKKTHNVKPTVKDQKLEELQRKLEAKKAERQQEQEKLKLTPNTKSAQRTKQLIKNKKALEANRWEELERTKERTAKVTSRGVMSSKTASRFASSNKFTLTS